MAYYKLSVYHYLRHLLTQPLLQPRFKKFTEQSLAHQYIQLRWNQFFKAHNRPLAKMLIPLPNPLLTKAPVSKGREPNFSCFPQE